jgi:phospholipid/cholesterol/gamma-HCH transport system permease protein
MTQPGYPKTSAFDIIYPRDSEHEIVIRPKSDIDLHTVSSLLNELTTIIKTKKSSIVTVDLSQVRFLDEFGCILLSEIKDAVHSRKGKFKLVHANQQVADTFRQFLFDQLNQCAIIKKKLPNIFVSLGESTIRELFHIRYMVSFLGSVMLAFFQLIAKPSLFRPDDTLLIMKKTGVDALPIVALISFLLGFIMAFMSSLQLQQFGADIYVASLVALAMVSELGPIMTAIIVAGRSGSAFAAEIGTMQISEEIDALYTMGFNPTVFLVIPRIIGALIVVPLLTLFSDLFAIAGGLMVGLFILGLSVNTYMEQTIEAITLFEVCWGLAKSIVFSMLITWTGCLRGFQTRGGPASVGNSATSAVVSSIFLIILFDSIFGVIRSYW